MYIELNIVFIELVKHMLYIELIAFMELMKKRSYENETLLKNRKKCEIWRNFACFLGDVNGGSSIGMDSVYYGIILRFIHSMSRLWGILCVVWGILCVV